MAKKPRPEDLLDWIGLTDAPDWRLARPFGRLIGFVVSAVLIFVPILVIFALIAAFVVVLGTAHQVLTGAGGPNLGAGALIAAILGAPFVIWGTVIKHRQLGFQKEGHITDRISKAVEQLGAEKVVSRQLVNTKGKKVFKKRLDGEPDYARPVMIETTEPNIEVRIGGLLSLERISQDSVAYDKGRDHVRVMEILCAYVRNNAPASGAKRSLRELWQTDQDAGGPNHAPASEEQFRELHRIHPLDDLDDFISPEATADWASRLPMPREDIQLALSILGRRDANQRRHEARWGKNAKPDADWVFDTPCPALPEADKAALTKEALDAYAGYRLDLRGSNLQRADLSSAIFSGARLAGARMEGAILVGARMEG
ncbi:MAG: pentapeptide repeat-containing protein, partial [Thioclava sp.]